MKTTVMASAVPRQREVKRRQHHEKRSDAGHRARLHAERTTMAFSGTDEQVAWRIVLYVLARIELRQPIVKGIPREGMCWEQSRAKRTIATSRCDDNRARYQQMTTYELSSTTKTGDYAKRYPYAATPMETAFT